MPIIFLDQMKNKIEFTDFFAAVMIVVIEGFATYSTWNWFIVPFGVVSVSFPQMVGIQIAIRLFKPREIDIEKPFRHIERISLIFIIALSFAYMLTSFM